MALGTFWSDRAGGRRSARAQAAAHAEALDRVAEAVTRAVADEAAARHAAHPGPGDPRRSRSADPGPGCGSDDPSTTTPSSCGWASARSPPPSRCARPAALGDGVDEVEHPPIDEAPDHRAAGRGRRPRAGRSAGPGAAAGTFAGRPAGGLAQPAAPAPRRAECNIGPRLGVGPLAPPPGGRVRLGPPAGRGGGDPAAVAGRRAAGPARAPARHPGSGRRSAVDRPDRRRAPGRSGGAAATARRRPAAGRGPGRRHPRPLRRGRPSGPAGRVPRHRGDDWPGRHPAPRRRARLHDVRRRGCRRCLRALGPTVRPRRWRPCAMPPRTTGTARCPGRSGSSTWCRSTPPTRPRSRRLGG